MTNKEALAAVVSVSVSDALLEKALSDSEISGSATYSKDNIAKIDSAALDVLFSVWSTPDVSEGGFSVKYDRAALKIKIEALAAKCGRTDVVTSIKPTVKKATPW